MRIRRVVPLVLLACSSRPSTTPHPPSAPDAAAAASDAGTAAAADPPPPTLRLPGDVRPLRIGLDLTIDPTQTGLSGRVHVDAQVVKPTRVVWMNATDLGISAATIGGAPARVIAGNDDFVGLAMPEELPTGPVSIDLDYTGSIDREHSRGVYAQQDGSDWYAYTFFEPIDARRAFPCFDEPDDKIPWDLTFHVPSGDVALGNAPVADEHDDGTQKTVRLEESKPLPSYLVAFVVGPFDVVDDGMAGRAKTPLRFVVPKGHQGELAYAKQVTPKVVAALESYFDMDYPFGKLDVAVVPRYWGTMEHPGIVAMGQPLTLIKPDEDTRARREHYTDILAHELSHYWFGDLLTLAWWDDTWLNEALGEWLDPIITDAAEPSWHYLDARVTRAEQGMAADETATHPIRQPALTRAAIEASFDNGITYAKGSAVLHMFEMWVGADKWRDFIRAYAKKFAWGNVTDGDFVDMMTMLGPDVPSAFRTFLDQPGVPVISASCAGGAITLHQARSVPAGAPDTAPETWKVPVCVRADGGIAQCALLDKGDATIAVKSCPKELLLDAGANGYYRSAYTVAQAKALLARGKKPWLTSDERRRVISDVTAARRRGEISAGDELALVPSLVADPDDKLALASTELLAPLDGRTLDDAHYALAQKYVVKELGPLARKLGWTRGKKDSDDRQKLRLAIVPMVAHAGDAKLIAAAKKLATAWLDTGKGLDDDTVGAVLHAALGDDDAKLFDQVLERAKAAADKRAQGRLLAALGAFRDPKLVARALEVVAGTDFDLRDSSGIVHVLLAERATFPLAWDWIQGNLATLIPRMRSDEAGWLLAGIARSVCDAAHRDDAAKLLEPIAKDIDGAENGLDEALADVDQCIATAAQDHDSVDKLLEAYR